MSVLARNQAALAAARDWRALGRPPFDYDTIDSPFWRKCSALKSEGDWFSHQIRPKKK